MSYLEKRMVGPFSLEIKTNGFYRLTYLDKPVRIPETQARLLWFLAEHPDQMMDVVEVYKKLYGARPPKLRPCKETLSTELCRTRASLRNASMSGQNSYLVSDYQGGVGFFRHPRPMLRTVHRGPPKEVSVQSRFEVARQA